MARNDTWIEKNRRDMEDHLNRIDDVQKALHALAEVVACEHPLDSSGFRQTLGNVDREEFGTLLLIIGTHLAESQQRAMNLLYGRGYASKGPD